MKKFQVVSSLLLRVSLLAAIATATSPPELPHTYLETHYVTPIGTVRIINPGGDLQAAIDASVGGDEIVLQAGARFVGNYILKPHSGSVPVTIRSSKLSDLKEGTRVTPTNVVSMATLSTPNVAPALDNAPSAAYWRISGIELTVEPTLVSNANFGIALGYLGNGQETPASLPSDITFDRTYIHGTPICQCKRGVTFNGKRLAVVDSWISDIHVVGQDTQAIIGYNGPGPFKIVNNELEGAGENVLFGGSDPSIVGLVPSDIEIRRNHFFKPLTWKVGDPSYAGTHWLVKNLFEIKSGQRIIIDGNVFENSWVDGQDGVAISFKSSNQNDGIGCPQCFGGDILFSNNIIKNALMGFAFVGQEVGAASSAHNPPQAPVRSTRISVSNVLADLTGGSGTYLLLFVFNNQGYTYTPGFTDTSDVQITHLTALHNDTIAKINVGDTGLVISPNFLLRDSVIDRITYGFGAGGAEGSRCYSGPPCYLGAYFTPYTWDHMLLLNTSGGDNMAIASIYPAAPATEVISGYTGFVNYAGGKSDYHNYALTTASVGHGAASDGKDLGIDLVALDAAMAGSTTAPNPPIPPANKPPVLTILTPTNGSSVKCGSVKFTATAKDTEDGDIAGKILWSNGAVGESMKISYNCGNAIGPKSVNATVIDSGGLTAGSGVQFKVTK